MILARGRVEDVPAVELPGGKQVERRREQADPRRTAHRMKQEVARWHPWPQPSQQRAQRQWIAKNHGGVCSRQWDYSRVGDGDGQRWNRKEETGDGSGEAHIKQSLAGINRGPNSDEGSQRSNQRWRGDEVRIAGRDTVISAGKIVAKLVRQQNPQKRESVRHACEQELWVRKQRRIGRKEVVDIRRPPCCVRRRELRPDRQSRNHRQQEQQHGGGKRLPAPPGLPVLPGRLGRKFRRFEQGRERFEGSAVRLASVVHNRFEARRSAQKYTRRLARDISIAGK